MPSEYGISLKFNIPDNVPKINSGLIIAVILFYLLPVNLGSETLTMTTYYPAPYGGYTSILTTGPTFLARNGGSIGIGTTDITLAAPNTKDGNLYVNDVYLRSRSEWLSRLPTTIIRKTDAPCNANETLSGGGCRAQFDIGWPSFGFTVWKWTVSIPGVTILSIIVGCGTKPQGDGRTMLFIHPWLATTEKWVSCVRNRP